MIVLNDRDAEVLFADLTWHRKPDEILKRLRAATESQRSKKQENSAERAPTGHGHRGPPVFNVHPPESISAGSSIAGNESSVIYLPVDQDLEANARQWAVSDNKDLRWLGARAMIYFKSDKNAALLRTLLDDDATWGRREMLHLIAPQTGEEPELLVRWEAWHVLDGWGYDCSETEFPRQPTNWAMNAGSAWREHATVLPGDSSVGRNLTPHPALCPPIGHTDDRTQVPLLEWVAPAHNAGQKQQGFLEVGRKLQQVHDLRHARPGDVPQPGQIGPVGHDAVTDEALEANRQRHEPRNPRHAAGYDFRRRRVASPQVLAAVATAMEVDLGLESDAFGQPSDLREAEKVRPGLRQHPSCWPSWSIRATPLRPTLDSLATVAVPWHLGRETADVSTTVGP